MENFTDHDLEKSSYDESDSESDNDKDNDQSNEQFAKKLKKYFNHNKNLMVCVNHPLLGFCLCQFVWLA